MSMGKEKTRRTVAQGDQENLQRSSGGNGGRGIKPRAGGSRSGKKRGDHIALQIRVGSQLSSSALRGNCFQFLGLRLKFVSHAGLQGKDRKAWPPTELCKSP